MKLIKLNKLKSVRNEDLSKFGEISLVKQSMSNREKFDP